VIRKKALPCPFCGHRQAFEYLGDKYTADIVATSGGWQVECKCGAAGPTKRTELGAVRAWNSRRAAGGKG